MKTFIIFGLVLSCFAGLYAKKCMPSSGKKNIVFILCDDLGYNDPSFRGNNEILTPNIDALFYQGITLNRYYTAPLCTPSRTSLLTGRYSHHVGMQNEVAWNHQPWGLGLDQKIFPEYFKEAGYKTHMLGKWHLGLHQKQYTPTMRGFDTHFGFLGVLIDYFERIEKVGGWTGVRVSNLLSGVRVFGCLGVENVFGCSGVRVFGCRKCFRVLRVLGVRVLRVLGVKFPGCYRPSIEKVPPSNFPNNTYSPGYDFRNNLEVDRSDEGMYVTDLLTKRAVKLIEESDSDPFFLYFAHLAMHRANDENPLQAKEEDIAMYSHIQNPKRRTYAAMVKSLDDSVGEVVAALKRANKLQDTIIVFTSDNGGPTAIDIAHPNTASNYPLRGMKGVAWEGGIRVDCAVYAPWLPSGVKRDAKFHVTDWLPTLATLANADIKFDRFLDGMDLSKMLKKEEGPFRNQVETINTWYLTTSLISNQFKYMNSSYAPAMGLPDVWLGTNENVDHDKENYISRVLNSKVAKSLKMFGKPLTEEKIKKLRENLKISCGDVQVTECNVLQAPCLFNIDEDPCERNNLANDPAHFEDLQKMISKFNEAMAEVAPALNKRGDPLSDPSLHNGIWTWWQPDEVSVPTSFGKYAQIFK